MDLNADVGESFGRWRLGDDAALMQVVTSANVACGFHAGDPSTIATTCVAAVQNGVAIGAQVSYRDLAGFGRRFIDVEHQVLVDDVIYQIGALAGFARVAGGAVGYVKPHGALYNAVVRHEDQAAAVVEAVAAYDASLVLVGLPGSRLLSLAAEAGLQTIGEAFADRAYDADGSLVARSEPGSVLSDPELVARRVLDLVSSGRVTAVDGTQVEVVAQSVCVHGDSPGAVQMASRVRTTLEGAGIGVETFG